MSLAEYTMLALSSLLVIIDPVAVIPAFLAMTPNDAPEQRLRMARIACAVVAIVLTPFAIFGQSIFKFFGIGLPAFQMAGSIILLLIALDMLRGQRSRVQETKEETDAGLAKDDIAITPLAVPMLAGPGAISTVMLLRSKVDSVGKQMALLVAIVIVAGISYLVFSISTHGAKWLSPILLRLITRIMGLLLAAIAMQFLVNALTDLGIVTLKPVL